MPPSVHVMPPADLSTARALQDREIMLRCLAAAASTSATSDLAEGRPGRRVLDLRLRTTASRRAALLQSAEARAMRNAPPRRALDNAPSLQSRLSMGLLHLDLQRGDLLAERYLAADLRDDARALRAQAEQARRQARRRSPG